MSVLEGLYWNDDENNGKHSISQVFDAGPLSELNYRLMILLPEYVNSQDLTTSKTTRSPSHKNVFDGIEFFEYNEGKCIQMLHKGPFIYHYDRIHRFASKARTLKTFDPEYLELIVVYKLTSMVQMQLGRNQQNPLLARAFIDLNSTLSSAVAQLWADFINIPDNPKLAIRYYQLVRSTLYANGRSGELSYEILRTLAHDAKVIKK